MRYLSYYLLLVNIITFAAFAIDKQKARRGEWRIPERTLLSLSGIGGAAGGFIAMRLFRHKTRKPAFSVGVPLMLLLQAAVIGYILFRYFG